MNEHTEEELSQRSVSRDTRSTSEAVEANDAGGDIQCSASFHKMTWEMT